MAGQPDGVKMVVLMVKDTHKQNVGDGARAVEGQNAFSASKSSTIVYDRQGLIYWESPWGVQVGSSWLLSSLLGHDQSKLKQLWVYIA